MAKLFKLTLVTSDNLEQKNNKASLRMQSTLTKKEYTQDTLHCKIYSLQSISSSKLTVKSHFYLAKKYSFIVPLYK